jgi:hypothetical protein
VTTYEKAMTIIAEVVEKHRGETGEMVARRCLDALREKRIVPHTMAASGELFKRFHAHTRYLGRETMLGYRHYYDMAVQHAVTLGEWPIVVRPVMIELPGGEVHWRDANLPDTSKKATTSNLMTAYSVIEDEAKQAGVVLPEGDE